MENENIFDSGYPCSHCESPCRRCKRCVHWLAWFESAWRKVVSPFRKIREERENRRSI